MNVYTLYFIVFVMLESLKHMTHPLPFHFLIRSFTCRIILEERSNIEMVDEWFNYRHQYL